MELTIKHVISGNFTVQDQEGCYYDVTGDQFFEIVYLKSHEVAEVVGLLTGAFDE